MILWRPLHIAVILAFSLPTPLKFILEIVAFLVFVLLAGGKKKPACITAIYLWDIGLLTDVVFSCLFAGITGRLSMLGSLTLYLQMTVVQLAMLLWAVFYYFMMRAISEETHKHIPLRFWLITLLAPIVEAIALFAAVNPLKAQLEAGFNNFLYFGLIGLILFFLNLCLFYLYIKHVTSLQAPLLAGELANTPPVYTPAAGLSEAFIQKYDLSKRQVEATEALLQGKSNKEIATALDIEVNTVQVHLQNVYRKTGAPGRYALMALVGQGTEKA
jgi:DNA-binding CsgD family transcriptional regulator